MSPLSYWVGKIVSVCATLVFPNMPVEISIEIERQNHGDWLNVYIPYQSDEAMACILQNEYGEVIKKVKLKAGSNSIDISSIKNTTINLKIETAYETILKKLNLDTL